MHRASRLKDYFDHLGKRQNSLACHRLPLHLPGNLARACQTAPDKHRENHGRNLQEISCCLHTPGTLAGSSGDFFGWLETALFTQLMEIVLHLALVG